MLQRRGIESVISALENDEATLVLLERENDDTRIDIIRQLCDEKGVKIEEGSQRDIWRMATPAKDGEPEHAIALALVGREPNLPLTDVFANGGLIWLLDGVQYATNMGFCIRTAEVSGANAVVVSNKMNHAERSAVKGSSMKATRFIPVSLHRNRKNPRISKRKWISNCCCRRCRYHPSMGSKSGRRYTSCSRGRT